MQRIMKQWIIVAECFERQKEPREIMCVIVFAEVGNMTEALARFARRGSFKESFKS